MRAVAQRLAAQRRGNVLRKSRGRARSVGLASIPVMFGRVVRIVSCCTWPMPAPSSHPQVSVLVNEAAPLRGHSDAANVCKPHAAPPVGTLSILYAGHTCSAVQTITIGTTDVHQTTSREAVRAFNALSSRVLAAPYFPRPSADAGLITRVGADVARSRGTPADMLASTLLT